NCFSVSKDKSMLDWKKKVSAMRDSVDDSVEGASSYFGGIWASRAIGGVVGVYLLGSLVVGWYWSLEPELFPVQQQAQAAAADAQVQLVPGYTTVETLKSVAGTLLDKSGGYLSND